MKTLNSKLLVAAVLAGGLGAMPLAHAQGGDELTGCGHQHHRAAFGERGGPEMRMERMADRLDLTQEQRTAVRAIVDKNRPEMRALRDKMRDNGTQLRALTGQTKVDDKQVRALADAQGKAYADMIVLRARMRTDIGNVLTDQQRQQMQQMRGTRGPGAV